MSMQRRCDIFKAQDGQWYMTLGKFEYAEADADCTTYGPFASQEAAERELDNHSNPGGFWTDESGKQPVPAKAVRSRSQSFRSNFRRW